MDVDADNTVGMATVSIKLTSPPILQEVITSAKDLAETRFRKAKRFEQEFWLLNDTQLTVASPVGSEYENSGWVSVTIRELAQRFKAHTVLSLHEAWISEQQILPGQEMPEIPKVQPRHDPNRREALSVLVETFSGHQTWQAPITRDENGDPILGEWVLQDYTRIGGRLAYLVPPKVSA